MQKQTEGWALHFKNGSSAYADIVIAADGANSKIRPYITNSKAFYSGVTMQKKQRLTFMHWQMAEK